MKPYTKYPDNFVDVGIDDDGTVYHKDANGKYHNPYGPAKIYPDGSKDYYIHGKLHRTDGPARIKETGEKEYYVNGKELSEEEFNKLCGKKEASLKLSSEEDKYPDNFVDVTMDEDGYIYHKDANGKKHNPYGPAVIYPSGGKDYFIHGVLHRTDGPAVMYSNGYKAYWIHGKLHRTDGPAAIYSDGCKEYYVNGNCLSKQEFNKLQPQLQAEERDRLFESQPNYSKEPMPNINENTGKRYTSLKLTNNGR